MKETSLTDTLENIPTSRFHYRLLAICSLIYAFTGMDVMLISALLTPIALEWTLNPVTVGLLASAGYVGMFFGAILCGFLADTLGRKKTLMLTVTLFSVFTGLCALAWDVSSMALLRFIAGIGLGGALPQPGIYISEYVPARHRGRFLGFTESAWVYGVLLAMFFGWMNASFNLGWRIAFSAALIPLTLLPPILFLLPESIRYLEAKGRKREASKILWKHGIHLSDPQLDPGTRWKNKLGNRQDTRKLDLLMQALKRIWSPLYWKRTLVLWVLWAVLVYTYHGIFIWLPSIYYDMGFELVRALWFTLIVTLVQIPGYYAATLLLDRVGRKPVLIVFLTFAGIGSYLFSVATDITSVLIWSGMVSFFNLGAWAGLYAYTSELYPTRIRGTASGFAASIGRFAGIFAPTLTPLIWSAYGLGIVFLFLCGTHLIAASVVWVLGLETRQRILEEISK